MPPIKEAAPQPANKNTEQNMPNVQKMQKVARLPAKMEDHFLQGHKTPRLPRKMDVLKFISGRRSKCTFLNFKIKKNAFRLHEEQTSNGKHDNF